MDHLAAPFTIAAPQLFDGTAMRGPALVTVAGGLIESVSFGDASPAESRFPRTRSSRPASSTSRSMAVAAFSSTISRPRPACAASSRLTAGRGPQAVCRR